MDYLELVNLLRELYDNNMSVNFNSLLNTIQLVDEIYRIESFTSYDTTCLTLYNEKRRVICNLWILFTDDNTVYMYNLYSLKSESDEHNINRELEDDMKVKPICKKVNYSWSRGDE